MRYGTWLRAAMVTFAIGAVACGGDDDGGTETTAGDTRTTGVLDVPIPPADTTPPDDTAPTPDTRPVQDTTLVVSDVEGGFGASCNANIDCLDGWCVEGPEGFVCTRGCSEQCPVGYDCKGVGSLTDVVFLCVPRLIKLCTPCLDDLQCHGGVCLRLDGQLSCASPCDDGDDCPSGFSCLADPTNTTTGTWCQPSSGSCTCNAEVDGGLRSCAAESGLGRCLGVEACEPLSGWSECSARPPVEETCNGVDDDCDGLVDEDLAEEGAACDVVVEGVGTCDGIRRCQGEDGWTCQGPTPTVEVCDLFDNDCDGSVDEDFKTGDVYSHFEHCGACNNSCGTGFPGASLTRCQVSGNIAQCVVVACDEGFIKLNDFQCIPEVVNLCQACATNDNCIGQDAACVTLDDGMFCGKGCEGTGDCPTGFECDDVGAASKQCVPESGVCSCVPETEGLSRACSVTVSLAGQPSYTCAGSERCEAGGWGACELPVEACDGVDNDCDEVIDEDFRDDQGRYDGVANCGGCGISCLALSFEHASPVCDTSGGGAPQCSFECDGAYVDVDGLPGCECLPTSTTDLPDPLGTDANCDGVDGEVDNGVFVAKTGHDGATGAWDDPVRTLQAGIDRAKSDGKRDVYVATGVYVESITLKAGVHVYGGYSPSFTDRDVDVHEAALMGVTPTDTWRGTINARNIGGTAAGGATVDGFTIFGANNPAASGNSYAVYLRDVGGHVTISRNLIIAGDGGAGVRGVDGAQGDTESNPGHGAPGVAARNAPDCTSSDHAVGGAGGSRTCGGVSTDGGRGGTRICPDAPAAVKTTPQTPEAQEWGEDGDNAGGSSLGDGGEPGWDDLVGVSGCGTCSSNSSHTGHGAYGEDGRDGSIGAAATSCSGASSVSVSGHWRASSAGSGGAGLAGGGGGGGGAAGGIDILNCSTRDQTVGGSGGGGGAGGCPGEGGTGGGGGGGSFGIFLTWATAPASIPRVQDNLIHRGRGGSGGQGGSGGVGGAGGFGAVGGDSGRGSGGFPKDICGSGGGAGGNGGSGGHGAGGAGGCGGPSYGIFVQPSGQSQAGSRVTGNSFPQSGGPGAGGAGGFSLGNPGPSGDGGDWDATNY